MDGLLEALHEAGWPHWVIALVIAIVAILSPLFGLVRLLAVWKNPATPTVMQLFNDLKEAHELTAQELKRRATRAEEKADKAEEKAERMRADIMGIQALHAKCVQTVHQLERKLTESGR